MTESGAENEKPVDSSPASCLTKCVLGCFLYLFSAVNGGARKTLVVSSPAATVIVDPPLPDIDPRRADDERRAQRKWISRTVAVDVWTRHVGCWLRSMMMRGWADDWRVRDLARSRPCHVMSELRRDNTRKEGGAGGRPEEVLWNMYERLLLPAPTRRRSRVSAARGSCCLQTLPYYRSGHGGTPGSRLVTPPPLTDLSLPSSAHRKRFDGHGTLRMRSRK